MKAIFLILSFVVFLTGCNTISGVGKDIQKAGESIEEAAKRK